jgi:predicted acylesterase/phospholipase RssA
MATSYKIKTRDEHFSSDGPKRILALDGGGLKGIVTLGFLERIEDTLRERHGAGPGFRLAHYFDLVAGTSTGAIIAAALATGMSVSEVTKYYLTMGEKVFNPNWFRKGIIRARYDDKKLRSLLKDVLGADTTLGDPALKTGLLLMTKRMDTGSPWPLGNNPRGRYFAGSAEESRVGNADYPLWQVVRASTAAPAYFDPETLIINEGTSRRHAVRGSFVDGGVTPFNNPALQAFMYATLDGYRVNWPTGADQMLIVSVGTGHNDPESKPSKVAAQGAVKALLSLMDDCAMHVETMMQWMSAGTKISYIDRELGDLRDDLVAPAPLFSYARYDVSFEPDEVNRLKPGLPEKTIKSLSSMDETGNLLVWKELGELAAAEQVEPIDFPHKFDLPPR